MSAFLRLRLILQQPRPTLEHFLSQLQSEPIPPADLDLLLRKTIESKLGQQPQCIHALISKGANVNFYDSKDHVSNLMLACEKGTYTMVENLLLYPQLNLLHKDARHVHAGFYAVQNKSKEDSQGIMRLLIHRQSKIVNQEAGNQTLLIAAIRKGKNQLVKMLLEAGADPNWQVPDTGNTPLHDAVKQFKSKPIKAVSEIIRLLLLKGADSFKKNKQQKTVYDYAQKALGQYQRIEQTVRQILEQQKERVQCLFKVNNQQEIEEMMMRARGLFEVYEVQEKEEDGFLKEQEVCLHLEKQILEFQKKCNAQYELAQKDIKNVLNKLEKIVANQGLTVQLDGSFATGLWVSHAGIDIQLVRKDLDRPISPRQLLQSLQRQLTPKSSRSFSSSIIYPRGIPTLRLHLPQSNHNRILLISIADRMNANRSVVSFIKQQLNKFASLKPMFLVLKWLCGCYNLNQGRNGGLRGYALVIMLLSCISKWNISDLGKLLIDFLFYFGFYYDYLYQRKHQPNQLMEQDYAICLQIIDPLNPSQDLGKNVRVNDLQQMFRAAYIGLHTNVGNGGVLPVIFDMHKIMV